MSSQRSPGFQGGIKRGTKATSAESAALETTLRSSSARIADTFPELKRRGRLDGTTIASLLGVDYSGVAGVQPDGGIWYVPGDDRPLVVSEAKKQGKGGNAIERWFKNAAVFEALDAEIYLTVCTGDGFFGDGCSAKRSMELACLASASEKWRLQAAQVWNVPVGRLWFYRYRTAADAAVELDSVVTLAVQTALQRRVARLAAPRHALLHPGMHELPGPT